MKNQTASSYHIYRYHLRRITGSIANGDYGEDDVENENDNGTAEPAQEDEGEKSLPLRLPGVSLSGRRTTRFVLR